MENADIVIALLVVLGVFSGGILFGQWLLKRIQPKVVATDPKLVNWDAAKSATWDYGNEAGPRTPGTQQAHSTYPVHPAQQAHPSTGRVAWPSLRRELEEDDPEAKRHEEIMKANEPMPVIADGGDLPRKRIKPAKETNARK